MSIFLRLGVRCGSKRFPSPSYGTDLSFFELKGGGLHGTRWVNLLSLVCCDGDVGLE